MGDHNARMQELRKEVDSLKHSMKGVTSSVAEIRQSVDASVAQAMDKFRRLFATSMNNNGSTRPAAEGVPRDGNRSENYHLPTRNYQMDFTKFDGQGLREWIYRCEQFFDVDETPDDSRVKLASCNFEGKALQWHQSYMKHRISREWPRWTEYVGSLFARFGAELFDDPMGDFKDLRQVNSVQDYVDLFDELLTRVELSEDQIISCFVRGLKPEIGLPVKMLAPRSLAKAINLARIQEQTLVVQKQVFSEPSVLSNPKNIHRFVANNSSFSYVSNQPTKHNPITSKFQNPTLANNPKPQLKHAKLLSPAEMEERRSKGLCFNCDEKYSYGHVCKKKRQLFYMEVEEGEGEPKEMEDDIMVDPTEFFTMIGQGLETDNEGAILTHVSVHAMNGSHDFRTMRVTMSVKGKVVHVLIDTCSTHNFLDLNTAKKLGCVMIAISPFAVSVADGKKIQSNYVCKKLAWKMQGVSFDSDMLVLPIGGCNMVLGIQWLITLGDIMWNFRRLKMEFTIMGRKISLRGIQPAAVKMVHQDNMDKLLAKPAELCMISFGVYKEEKSGSLLSIEAVPDSDVEGVNDLECILQEYSDLFEVPKDLPPSRFHDHKIILQDGTSPINIRPYRYPTAQKDEIERMVEDMLHSGVIRHSTNPYSSPIVMVKKKDGTWRMCVDYRELNSHTVKDKFPIPVIEELLDELHGAKYFSFF
ncbi:uncharacterized protein LOC125809928 [Solanum verrucosum]|uniref:uncharacterized protein LOC125809928 n=1 Tax=Solanum verrucosum TaxID=315347 RepID=UPI0020D15772|nr:uncharacterized protein LOC125809928 [Solanum verrucosum]